jgi:hypothetical protein
MIYAKSFGPFHIRLWLHHAKYTVQRESMLNRIVPPEDMSVYK